MSRDKWSVSQEKRAKNIFEQYQKREEAYNPINSLRALFRNKKLTKETTKEKYGEGYEKVSACSMREIKSVSNTIKFYADEIQNLFIERQTNASAKSYNSKIKCFRQRRSFLNVSFGNSFVLASIRRPHRVCRLHSHYVLTFCIQWNMGNLRSVIVP